MAQVSTYLALIPSANAALPKFTGMVAAACQPFVDAINFFESMTGTFALASANGAQLTTLGLWVGVGRYVSPLVAWFSFDTAGVGWDQGVWWQLGEQQTTGSLTLDDTTMLLLIHAKILWNKWDGTTPTLYTILSGLFPNCLVTITDNLNLSITVTVIGQNPSAPLKLMATGFLLPFVPIGVTVSYTFVA
jgi:hypothetical protein